jgi:hypothetical protein
MKGRCVFAMAASIALGGLVGCATVPLRRAAPAAKLDWPTRHVLSNDCVRLTLLPCVAGRIIAYERPGEESLFWVNPDEQGRLCPITPGVWHNYGGHKVWNAPQGAWGWPPDPYLDVGGASLEAPDSLTALTVGTPSFKAGIVLSSRVQLDGTGSHVRVEQSMTGVGEREVEWSIWGVTQVKPPDWVVFPVNPRSRFEGGTRSANGKDLSLEEWTVTNGWVWIHTLGDCGKLGSDSTAGWIAAVRGGQVFLRRFATWPDRRYPHDGDTVEVFTCPAYTEVEVVGPMTRLAPGQRTTFAEDWYLERLPAGARDPATLRPAIEALLERTEPPCPPNGSR